MSDTLKISQKQDKHGTWGTLGTVFRSAIGLNVYPDPAVSFKADPDPDFAFTEVKML